MQLYVLNRARIALATTDRQYNDLHHMELGAGASTYVFTLDKHDQNGVADPAAQYLVSGNLVVLQDDKKVPWAFTIMSVEEKHDTITATCADVGIELYNKACDAWAETDAHPFEYYFDECTDGTPWQLGINQLSDLSRKLVYTGRDTGLGRLLSVLKGFDDAECKFRVEVSGTMPAKFIVDVYKQIGTVQENVVLDYGNEVNEITRTESRAAFVTALQGVGGVVEQKTDDTTPATADTTVPEVHVDFEDLEYDQDGFYSPKGDPMLYAVTANKQFNPGQESYIENFYDYDTQSASELLNRTLSQLKTLSEPQLTFNVEAKVIDPTLEIGDTVRIVDHSYQPALYLSARVATLERSYSDPSKNTITFTNYAILTADDQLRELQNIVNQLPTNATIGTIVTNVVNAANAEIKQQLTVALTSADGKNTIYYDAKPSTAKENDTAFVKNADGDTEIWRFHNGAWELDIGVATKEQVDQAIKEMDTDVKAAKQQADDAVSAATDAVAKAAFANDAAEQAKTIAEGVATQAANALDAAQTADTNATTALANANKALTAANGVSTTVDGLQQDVDTINAKWSSLATQTDVDALKGTVEDQATTIGQTVAGLALKADKSTVDTINKTVNTQSASLETLAGQVKLKAESSTVDKLNGSVSALSAQVNTQAGQISLMASKTDIAGMATQSYVQAQTKIVSDSITSTVSSAVNQITAGDRNYILNSAISAPIAGNGGANQGTPVSAWGLFSFGAIQNAPFTDGQSVMLSVEYTVTGTPSGTFYPQFGGTPWGFNAKTETIKQSSSTYVCELKWKSAWAVKGNTAKGIQIRCDNIPVGTTITFNHISFKASSVNKDWTPAPEDNATVTALTSLSQTVDAVKALATDNKDKYASLQLTVNGYQSTVTDKITGIQTQQTALANQYTSVVGAIGQKNFIANSEFVNLSDWTFGNAAYWTVGSGLYDGYDGSNVLRFYGLQSTGWTAAYSNPIPVVEGEPISISAIMYATGPSGWAPTKSCTIEVDFFDTIGGPRQEYYGSTNSRLDVTQAYAKQQLKVENIKVPTGRKYVCFTIQMEGPGNVMIAHPQLVKATTAGIYQSSTVSQSQLTQTQSDINLRVKTNDVINQINISKESILIDGKKVHITGTTTIDNGVIKNAMIADATINGAKIVDASILSAKIANLDGSKIVANSITADKLAADAVLVGLNNGAHGWLLTPEHMGFYKSDSTKPTLQLDPEGIVFADVVSNKKLGLIYGAPYNVSLDKNYSGIMTQLAYGGSDYWGVSVEEAGNTGWEPLIYSRKQNDTFRIFEGLTINARTHFKTIGPMDPSAHAQMQVVRTQVDGRWSTGMLNAPDGTASHVGGWLITDDGALYLGRANKWYNLADILKACKIAI